MPIATIQSQIQQLQAQLKLSQSPKQSKMLQSAIARLEEKLKEETAEQARLKAEAEAKAEQGAQVKKEGEAIAKKKTGIMSPKKEQELSDGTILKAVPGQGHHLFYCKVWGEIQIDETGDYHFLPEGSEQPIPITLGKRVKRTLEEQSLPVMRFCGLNPRITNGQIDNVQLNACANSEKQPDVFVAQGYWIAEEETLQIQTNFRFNKKRSRNMFHQIPVKDGITPPETGFRSLQLERDRLNVYVIGEVEVDAEKAG